MIRTWGLRPVSVLVVLAACVPPPTMPFDPVACEPPTWEQCAAPVTPCDRYFREQARTESRGACNLLFEQRAAAEASAFPEQEVVVPPLSRVAGLQKQPTTPTALARKVPVKRDTFNFTGLSSLSMGESFRDAATLPKSSMLSTQRRLLFLSTRDAWDDNGNAVKSCREYVHEKYYDYTLFEDRLRFGGFDDHRRVYDTAYAVGMPAPRWAIGTRHLTDPALRGRDNRPFGTLEFASRRLPKNQYFTVPAPESVTRVSFVAGPDDRVLYLPESNAVIIRLSKLANVGRTGLNLAGVVFNDATLGPTIESGRAFYDESWAWHRTMALRNASVLDEVLYDWDRKQDDFVALLEAREQQVLALVALLDPEAAARAPRLGASRLDQRWWLDPVWNPDPTSVASAARQGVDIRDVSLGGLAGPLTHPSATGIVTFSSGSNPAGTTAPSVRPAQPAQVAAACTGNPLICAAYRLAALDAAIEEEVVKARQAGCLDVADTTGPARCDWSPRRFAQSVLGRFRDEREATFQKCREYVEDFAELENKTLAFTNPTTNESFFAQADYTASAVALEQYYVDVDRYLDVIAGYLGPLLDRKEGKVRLKRTVGDAMEVGGDVFGAGFQYGLSFEALDVGQPNTCVIQQRVGATMGVDATLVGFDVDVFDANLGVSDTTATLSAKVFDTELLTGMADLTLGELTVLRDTKQETKTFFDEEMTIVVGFVPITLGGALVGAVGIDYGLEAGKKTVMSGGCRLERSGVVGRVAPFAWLQAQAWAGVDAVVAEAGVKGVLTLVLARLPLEAEVGIGPSASNPTVLDLTLDTSGALELVFFAGSISVYLEVGICPLCTSWEEPLIAWDGIKQRIPLFETTATVRLADLRLLINQRGTTP